MRFYLDTSIWMDLDMDRKGFKGEPFGEYAARLLIQVLAGGHDIVASDILIKELGTEYPESKINSMFNPFNTEKVISTKKQREEAERVSKERGVPRGDALHSIIARDNGLVMVTRDKHFKELKDICESHKPEELI